MCFKTFVTETVNSVTIENHFSFEQWKEEKYNVNKESRNFILQKMSVILFYTNNSNYTLKPLTYR